MVFINYYLLVIVGAHPDADNLISTAINYNLEEAIETTDLFDSSKPYELMESYKAMGIQPKTGRDLPYFNCVPDAKDKLPKDFLQRFGY